MQNSKKSDTNKCNQEKQFCPSCAKNGNVTELKLYQINFNEAVYLCPNYEKCLYPMGFEWQVVNRTLDQLYGSDDLDISDSESEKDEIEDLIQNLMKNKDTITETKDDLLFLFDNSNSTCTDITELPPINIPNSKRIKIVSEEIVMPKEEISYTNEHVLDFSNTSTNDIQCFKVEISDQNQFTIKEIDELINYNDNSNLTDIDFNLNLFENNENVQTETIYVNSLNKTCDSNDSEFTYTILPDESKQTNIDDYDNNQLYGPHPNNTDVLLNPIANLKIESEQKPVNNDRYNKWHLIPKSNTETLSAIEATQKKIISSNETDTDVIEIIEFNSTKSPESPKQNSKLLTGNNIRKNTNKKIKKDPEKQKTNQRLATKKTRRTQSPKPITDTSKMANLNRIQKKSDISATKRYNSGVKKSFTGSSAVLKEKVFGPGRYRPIEL